MKRGLRSPQLRYGLIFLACCGVVAFWRCLPHPLFREPLSTVLLSRDGELLGARIANDEQWRFPRSGRVPDKFRIALLQYEDRRFRYHPGVDPLALVRSLYLNVARGRIVSGGSTITMQVIRLARRNPERTVLEKIKEMLLALRLEMGCSKDEILALYAAHAPFGGNVVGLEAAAWRYFGRSAGQLSWAESCTLAVLPNSPSLIHPGRNRDLLKEKRDRLLVRLKDAGVLTTLEADLAIKEPLAREPLPLPRLASHLLTTLAAEFPSQSLFVTTIDRQLQLAVNNIVAQQSHGLALQKISNASALVVDNRNFEVIAYVGNSGDVNDQEEGGAVDIIRRPRSTGSVLKPLLYATMIQQGEILPTTLVPDLPTQYGGYMPENYDHAYRGAVPARTALAHSLNVPAVRMLRRYGVDRFYDFLGNMGMTTLFRAPGDYGLTLILGGAEGTLWDLTAMYANLAYIAKQDWDREKACYHRLKVRENDRTKTVRPAEIKPATAWLTLDALLEVNRPGVEGYWKNFSTSRKIAWKTGTSYGLRDGWAVGSTASYTVGVWVGNADGEGRPGLTGVGAAAPLMFDIFNRLPTAAWFVMPVDQMKEVKVCKDDGYLANDLCEPETIRVPDDSHFDRVTPYHHLIHLDRTGAWRVHSQCEPVNGMVHKAWFVLPPGQEYYFRRFNSDYRPLPPYRQDCVPWVTGTGKRNPIELLYPAAGTRVYIPVDLDGARGKVVFEAVHRERESTLYWHLDNEYIGETAMFHQMAMDIEPGSHQLTIVDQQGNRMERRFEVLGQDKLD